MPLNRAWIGRSFPAGEPYEVSREKIRDFANAIGDPNPMYVDREAAQALGYDDVIAPPTFPIVITLKLGAGVIFDPDLGLDYTRVVHGEQSFTHHRPIKPGDRLVGTPRITDIRDAGKNEAMTLEAEIRTVDGELVITSVNTIISRGTAASA